MSEKYAPPFSMTEKITNLIIEIGTLSAKELALSIDITQRQAQRILEKLKEQGRIVRHGATKNGFWEVVE